MSTVPGLASKGEKSKQKFQSLDINNLYRVSRGENLEKQQQKNPLTYKHGMQSLGKVPNARRAPANLPSLKAEHSGSEASTQLVPPGGSGWGKQDTPSTPVTTVTTTSQASTISTTTATPQLTAHQAAIALPVTTTIPQIVKHTIPQQQLPGVPIANDNTKSWSAIMTGGDTGHHPPFYQSPQFQHEFPSLSVGDGSVTGGGHVVARPPSDIPHYTPSLSLRPQTEGSWIQGGSRPGGDASHMQQVNSGAVGVLQQQQVQVGQSLMPQYRAVMPTFMCKGNIITGGSMPTQNLSLQPSNRRIDSRMPTRPISDVEEVVPRPIIKDEELSRMDELDKDMGWTTHDDIDYNQKLVFNDEDNERNKIIEKERNISSQRYRENGSERKDYSGHADDQSTGNWNNMSTKQRQTEEELQKRRLQHHKDMELSILRAKQRKEEEEKRFIEISKHDSIKKVADSMSLLNVRDNDLREESRTMQALTSNPKMHHTSMDIHMSSGDKGNTRITDNRKQSDNIDNENNVYMPHKQSSFRQLTQIEGKNIPRKQNKTFDKDLRDRDIRDHNVSNFSRQPELPPRFLKQKNSNLIPGHQFDNRWMNAQSHSKPSAPQNLSTIGVHHDAEYAAGDRDKHPQTIDNDSTQTKEDRFTSDRLKHWNDDANDHKNVTNKERRIDHDNRPSAKDWHIDRRPTNKRTIDENKQFERPQRPDSRDSRNTRDLRRSRETDIRDDPHLMWTEGNFDHSSIDMNRKTDIARNEDRRQVPGPITKERIEADNLRNESRNLTQLKRGQIPNKQQLESTRKDGESDIKNSNDTNANKRNEDSMNCFSSSNNVQKNYENNPNLDTNIVSNAISSDVIDSQAAKNVQIDTIRNNHNKMEMELGDKDDKRSNRMKSTYPQNKINWNVNNDYHRNNWSKKPPPRSNPNISTNMNIKQSSTECYLSDTMEGGNAPIKSAIQKIDKYDKNRDSNRNDKTMSGYDNQKLSDKNMDNNSEMFGSRNELSSRHGRGGSSFKTARGGMSKRIDGYGPPPIKSPFGNLDPSGKVNVSDDKEKFTPDLKSDGNFEHVKNDNDHTMDSVSDKYRKDNNKRTNSRNEHVRIENDIDNLDNIEQRNLNMSNKINPSSSKPMHLYNQRGRNIPPRLVNDKKPFGHPNTYRQNSSGSLRSGNMKKDDNFSEKHSTGFSITDMPPKQCDENLARSENCEFKSPSSHILESDGFQEVKNKKIVKDKLKSVEDKISPKYPPPISSNEKVISANKIDRKLKPTTGTPLSQQQISNIPSLLANPIPPPVLNKNQRSTKPMPPRFAKQRDSFQKCQNQPPTVETSGDMGKFINQSNTNVGKTNTGSIGGSWDKPNDVNKIGLTVDYAKNDNAQIHQSNSGVSTDKKINNKSDVAQEDQPVLDGSTPPVTTIIFENTSFKTAPGARINKPRPAKSDDVSAIDSSLVGNYNKPITDLIGKIKQHSNNMQTNLIFKEDNGDMKLDFFESDLSTLTDEKASKSLDISRSMENVANGHSTLSTAAALNFKIQSVKKMWETPSENTGINSQEDVFPTGFASDTNSGLDHPNVFKGNEVAADESTEVYTPSNQLVSTNTNVCKVKPTQQVTNAAGGGATNVVGQTVLASNAQHAPTLIGNPLSPPPLPTVLSNTGMGLGQPQQFTSNQHLSYQAGLGGSNQFGISAIPSPPTVMYNSTQQLQAAQTAAGLYAPFQIDQTGVLSGQGRTPQYSQYANHYNLNQTAAGPYTAQSMFLQTAQTHAPPTGQPPPPPPDLYTNINNYRLNTSNPPYGQSQQLNNPTTVLISSTSNTLMSASVKATNQQMGAIGTKASGLNQTYQPQSQQNQVYMAYEPTLQGNYLSNTALLQRGTGAPTMPASSYYSGSAGNQGGYYQQPTTSTLPSAQLQQHATNYGLQGNMFAAPSQTHNSAAANSLQNFNSHFLSTPMLAAALSAHQQQFRQTGLSAATQYMKTGGIGNQVLGDQNVNRSQQIKSPGCQEVLSSVFASGNQTSSPKLRQSGKQSQPSPTSQHKYLYQNISTQQPPPNMQRYPAPIQRPINFQHNPGGGSANSVTQKNRSMGGNTGNLTSQNVKILDEKTNDEKNLSISNKTGINASSINSSADTMKDPISLEKNSTMKE